LLLPALPSISHLAIGRLIWSKKASKPNAHYWEFSLILFIELIKITQGEHRGTRHCWFLTATRVLEETLFDPQPPQIQHNTEHRYRTHDCDSNFRSSDTLSRRRSAHTNPIYYAVPHASNRQSDTLTKRSRVCGLTAFRSSVFRLVNLMPCGRVIVGMTFSFLTSHLYHARTTFKILAPAAGKNITPESWLAMPL